jgi:hypothetical protein
MLLLLSQGSPPVNLLRYECILRRGEKARVVHSALLQHILR